MYRYKILIATILCLCALGSYSFAAVEKYDCTLVGLISEGGGTPKIFDKKFSYLLDKDSMVVALQNLRAYCCSNKSITDDKICNNIDSTNNYPESAYLYDHLIDVAIRKRDGWEKNAYGLKVDPEAKAYREYIDEIATIPEGKSPDEIIKKIKEFRIPNNAPMIEVYSPSVCAKTRERATLESKTLYEKLSNVCTIARCAYDAIVENSKKNTQLSTAMGYTQCQNMISQKIYNEFTYMNSIINQAANRKLQNNLNEYLTNYFARDRLINLQNKIGETYDAFAVVNRFVQEGSPQCSG